MPIVLTRFYLDRERWARLNYVSAKIGLPLSHVASALVAQQLDKADLDRLASGCKQLAEEIGASVQKEVSSAS